MFQYQFSKFTLFGGIVLMFGFFFGSVSDVLAAYSVDPLTVEVNAKPRDIFSRSLTVTNTGSNVVTLYPTVNAISLGEGGTIQEFTQAVESDRTRSITSWIEISRLGTNIRPGESVTMPFTIRMHPSPAPGVYHALIGFGTGRNRDEAEAMVMAGNAPGTIVTVTVEDEKVEFLKLSGFTVKRFITSKENARAAYVFKNPGNETLVPEGEIIIYDGTGKEVGTVTVNADSISIPPGGEHVFEQTLPVDGLFGKYKAFLSVSYGTAQRANIQDTNFFYAVPLKGLVILFSIVSLVVAVAAWRIHGRYFDEVVDDSEQLTFHVREKVSEAKHHDIDLKNKS